MTSTRALGSAYLLDEPIGRGAMGQVWRAVSRDGHQQLAVKVLRPELASEPEVVARFVQERSILVSLEHPNLVRVRDLVVEGETLAIVMDLVPGTDLRRFLAASGTLAPAQAAHLMAQVLRGLAVVHEAGVVHRDLKPENILLDLSDPTAPVARVTDFGIARITFGPSLTRMTGLIGTPEYMAPEVAERDHATPPADLYSAGIVLFELLTGRTPFAGGHPVAVLRRHLEDLPLRPEGMPDELWSVIEVLLAKDPADRPSSASAVARYLDEVQPALADIAPLAVLSASAVSSHTPPRISSPETSLENDPSENPTRMGRHRVEAKPDVTLEAPRRGKPFRRLVVGIAAVMVLVSAVAAYGLTRPDNRKHVVSGDARRQTNLASGAPSDQSPTPSTTATGAPAVAPARGPTSIGRRTSGPGNVDTGPNPQVTSPPPTTAAPPGPPDPPGPPAGQNGPRSPSIDPRIVNVMCDSSGCSADTPGTYSTTIAFENVADSDGVIRMFSIDFGDGSTPWVNRLDDNDCNRHSNNPAANFAYHQYPPGSYQLTFSVLSSGCNGMGPEQTATAERSVTVPG